MRAALIRKTRQMLTDSTLRAWLIGRALGRWPGEPSFAPHRPPYLAARLPLGPETPAPPHAFPAFPAFSAAAGGEPQAPLALDLAGTDITAAPGEAGALMARWFDDDEVTMALHRFAWLPLALGGPGGVDSGWAAALWAAWTARFGTPDESPAWAPYTTAERAVNMLDYARIHGLPGGAETETLLARHAPVIAERLEYFGEHHTSNHLANNGRGLYRLGLDLGLPQAAELGRDILLHEAERIFTPPGVLREDSSHYHLLLTRLYMDAWLAALRHNRTEAEDLRATAARAAAAAKALALPGRFPLIGDISPDCPPDFLTGPAGWFAGWRGVLPPEESARAADLTAQTPPADSDAMAAAGWLTGAWGPWSGLWHAPLEGWSCMPGHGHQDIGAFELHRGETVVVTDPGRGRYGETGQSAFDRSAAAHAGLQINGHDPYPPNKPYYSAAFRRARCGGAPDLHRTENGVLLRHEGFSRLAGVGAVERRWRFTETMMSIEDRVEGRGRRTVARRLVTPVEPKPEPGGAVRLGGLRIRFAEGQAVVRETVIWRAYGRGERGWMIEHAGPQTLPFSGLIEIEEVR